jgi:hypothetical protein
MASKECKNNKSVLTFDVLSHQKPEIAYILCQMEMRSSKENGEIATMFSFDIPEIKRNGRNKNSYRKHIVLFNWQARVFIRQLQEFIERYSKTITKKTKNQAR